MTVVESSATTVDVDLGDAWSYGAGVLHGGWLLETLAAAALERTAHPHPLAVSAQLCRPRAQRVTAMP